MKKRYVMLLILSSLIFLLSTMMGCYTIYKQNSDFSKNEISVIVSPNYNFKTHKKLAVMPFKGKAVDFYGTPLPHTVMEETTSDRFASQLMGVDFLLSKEHNYKGFSVNFNYLLPAY